HAPHARARARRRSIMAGAGGRAVRDLPCPLAGRVSIRRSSPEGSGHEFPGRARASRGLSRSQLALVRHLRAAEVVGKRAADTFRVARTLVIGVKPMDRHSQRRAFLALMITGTAVLGQAGVNRWTAGGPDGARVDSVASAAGVLYAGTGSGQIARSYDRSTWTVVYDGKCACPIRVVVDPTHPSVVYAVVYALSGHLLKTTDGGDHWRTLSLPPHVGTLTADPLHKGVLYATGRGDVFR